MSAALKISDELAANVAAYRATRPKFDFGDALEPQTGTDGEPRRRNRTLAASWRSDVIRAAAEAHEQYGAEAEEINAALAEAIAEGPDFARCHRGSDFRAPPRVNTDRNFIARLMFMVRMIERKSFVVRKKGKHGGTLGKSALRLLEIMIFVANKSAGYLTPSYETLARLACMSRRAIVTAMGVLASMGFVTIHRRIKRVQTALGVKVVQDTNAYEYHLPTKRLGAWAWRVFGEGSECKKFPAKEIIEQNNKTEGSRERETSNEADRFWLDEPWPTGAGGWR
jgi:hypothetical protein